MIVLESAVPILKHPSFRAERSGAEESRLRPVFLPKRELTLLRSTSPVNSNVRRLNEK